MNNNLSTNEKKMIVIKNQDGSSMEVELVTELSGADGDEVIYISKILQNGENLLLQEITDDNEWLSVQNLLKKIANA